MKVGYTSFTNNRVLKELRMIRSNQTYAKKLELHLGYCSSPRSASAHTQIKFIFLDEVFFELYDPENCSINVLEIC